MMGGTLDNKADLKPGLASGLLQVSRGCSFPTAFSASQSIRTVRLGKLEDPNS